MYQLLEQSVCYTLTMDGDQRLWRSWAAAIQGWGIENWLASLIESLGPLTILGAQLVYLAEPLINRMVPDDHLNAAARLLEDTNQARAFARMLRESPSS